MEADDFTINCKPFLLEFDVTKLQELIELEVRVTNKDTNIIGYIFICLLVLYFEFNVHRWELAVSEYLSDSASEFVVRCPLVLCEIEYRHESVVCEKEFTAGIDEARVELQVT